jgi:metal-responsive CopG/Arc/MetJ family transcriptional regulator
MARIAMEPMRYMHARIPIEHLTLLNEMMSEEGYVSQSDMIRKIVYDYLKRNGRIKK